MKKRSHKNTTRLTARERAWAIAEGELPTGSEKLSLVCSIIKALQAHARQALRRNDRRAN